MGRASWASSEGTRRSMVSNRGRDTASELIVRRILHSEGMRYRVDFAPVAGLRRRADVVFTRVKLAVFIDGCFWHACPVHGTLPKTNAEYWVPKIAANVARDRDTDVRLRRAGWIVHRFWEHEPARDVAAMIIAEYRELAASKSD